jgi:hypothetical protein
VTRDQAEQYAANLYDGNAAAVPLLLQSQHATTEEAKRRAWFALLCIDPLMPLPAGWPRAGRHDRWRGGPLDAAAEAIANLLLASLYCTNGAARRKAAQLLARFCREAEAVVSAAEDAA